jgi:mttA/Hcf106 family
VSFPRDDCLDAKEVLLADKYRIVILVLAMLLGARRLPSLGRNFGRGIRVFTKGITGGAQGTLGWV